MRSKFVNARARGFTLLELLLVIGTIALLASLLVPVLASGREKARSISCINNLRQWGTAFRLYADDYSEFLPRRGQGIQPLAKLDRPTDWFNALPGYLGSRSFQQLVAATNAPVAHTKSIFICPSAIDPGGTYFLPYGMNMNLSPWNLALPTKFAAVAQPEVVVAIAEGPGPYASTFPSRRAYGTVARHGKRGNVLFLAGQVEFFSGASLGCGIGDPQRPEVRWLTGTESDEQASAY